MTKIQDLQVLVYQLENWKDMIDVRLERVRQVDGFDKWAISEKGCCLNKQGEWELEPMPSSRTKAFFIRCRWDTAEAALEFWLSGYKSRFEHYRYNEYEQGLKQTAPRDGGGRL